MEDQEGILSGTSRLRYPSLPGIPDKMISLLTYGLIKDQEGILSTLICLDLTVTQWIAQNLVIRNQCDKYPTTLSFSVGSKMCRIVNNW